jgi:hypothetical protein
LRSRYSEAMYEAESPSTAELVRALTSRELPPTTRSRLMMIIRFAQTEVLPSSGGWTVRDQANAITAFAFRNGFLEEVHHGDPTRARITDAEMRRLMIESSARLAKLLQLRKEHPADYRAFLVEYGRDYCVGGESVELAASSLSAVSRCWTPNGVLLNFPMNLHLR